ncbi:2-iminobutanoate/2-iminopropanoate deaminase [Eurytemora carolleeae]|uniref:2-iminobutanoate/2-iminopropanoate deaminase n=1 Tax=Eurytemora carolleeae TaxID=1294199 RepID=UPI000C7727BF|nr:2-iminobutanoate/2-iminopropanoate deaminase [Eurytemora carolleeae]XP_023325635.1 2-iminobutanoate/2-iminopropanoate deaminase [Eurytemora carolleeae]|eukprot:XP_023325634.1 2-iminobutanoate/2-iminopropanoate deaminase-like [Eurytemora affinis]
MTGYMAPPTISNDLCRKVVNTNAAPQAIGPYNQGILVNRTLYVSGQLGLDRSLNIVPGGIEAETKQALDNIGHILNAAHSRKGDELFLHC